MRVVSRVLAVAVCGLLLTVPWVPATADDQADAPPPDVAARSWLVADLSTGQVLAAKDPHLRLRPASTLKTLTAVTLLPRLELDAEYEVQWEDAAAEGSAVGIVPGATYTVDQLFYGLFLPSGNDAAHALANAAGGVRLTVHLMQERAIALGAVDTTVRNPSGLDAPGQLTTAYDLALVARAGLRMPDFARYVSTVSTAFPAEMPRREGQTRKTYMIYNQNPLLLSGYRGVAGVKTGYTTLAGRTFVGAAERHGHLLVVVLLDIESDTESAARTLLDWGFHNLDATPVAALTDERGNDDHRQLVAGGYSAAAASAPVTSGWSIAMSSPAALAGATLVAAVMLLAVIRSRRQRKPRFR